MPWVRWHILIPLGESVRPSPKRGVANRLCASLAVFSAFFLVSTLLACTTKGNVTKKISVNPVLQGAANRENRVLGEYIATLRDDTDLESLKRLYIEYDVQWIKPIGKKMYLFKIAEDPGPEVIERKGLQSGVIQHIQPNFLYHAQPITSREPRPVKDFCQD